ncbi:hypothetical protein [Breoghania sp.]|uniref:hypothetical protein n=2 Tax=Breoghania sp. TaxID=2065378 RepID=UPI0039F087E5
MVMQEGVDGLISLSDLTKAQQTVLANLRSRPLWRVRNGWRQQAGGSHITLATGTKLLRAGLVEQTAGSLRLTPLGRLLADEADQRLRAKTRVRPA